MPQAGWTSTNDTYAPHRSLIWHTISMGQPCPWEHTPHHLHTRKGSRRIRLWTPQNSGEVKHSCATSDKRKPNSCNDRIRCSRSPLPSNCASLCRSLVYRTHSTSRHRWRSDSISPRLKITKTDATTQVPFATNSHSPFNSPNLPHLTCNRWTTLTSCCRIT